MNEDITFEEMVIEARHHASEHGHTVNVTPDDVIEHEGIDCICGPDVEYVENGGAVFIHHQLETQDDE